MKRLPLLLILPALCGISSCEKVRGLATRIAKKPPATESAVANSNTWISEISEVGYDTFRQQPGKLAIVDFHADWCGPCRQLGPILAQIVSEHGGSVVVGKINVDQNKELAAREGVRGIPDVRIYREGRLVDQFVGLPDESEVRRRIEAHALGLPKPAATGDDKPATTDPITRPMPKDWLPPGMQRR
ncbi:MAG: thioredoxin family protein [Luteolibacter sp.]|jgi:thioredoxin|nr:thioredoxin family protein [Luteolibacter sp.]